MSTQKRREEGNSDLFRVDARNLLHLRLFIRFAAGL